MPTTNSPKGTAIPVRPTPQMRQQLDELIAAGWGNQTDVIRTAIDRMHQQEKRTMELSDSEMTNAMQIAQDVIEAGRVLTTQRGTFNKESLRVEVSFEAGNRGYDAATAEAMAKFAVKHTGNN